MFNVNLFNYDKNTKTLTAEASELQPHGDAGRIIWIYSNKTKRSIRFELSKVLRTEDEDQEIYGWEYKPAREVQFMDVADVTVKVWND